MGRGSRYLGAAEIGAGPRWRNNLALALFFLGAPVLGLALGWKALGPRLAVLEQGFADRDRLSRAAGRMVGDFPIFGSGPGTYEAVSALYRPQGTRFWPAQAHNDWLEFRITFGAAGCVLLGLALAVVGFRWLVPGGLQGGDKLAPFLWLAIAGCLVHARFDFPFQVHSIVFLVLVLTAVLFTFSRRSFRGSECPWRSSS